jgi:hypothetical protein
MNESQIDAAILQSVTTDWTKVAAIIARVYDALEAKREAANKDLAQSIATRIQIMVDNGALSSQGNLRRWRDGSVKIVTGEA